MKTFTQGAKSSAIFRSCSASKGGALVAVFLGLSLVGVCWEPPSILGPCKPHLLSGTDPAIKRV